MYLIGDDVVLTKKAERAIGWLRWAMENAYWKQHWPDNQRLEVEKAQSYATYHTIAESP